MAGLLIRLSLTIGMSLFDVAASFAAEDIGTQPKVPESHTDWGVVVATIIGAMIGAAALWIVEYLRRERRAIKFIINAPEDLARALRPYGPFQVKVGDIVTQELTAASITIKNTGNMIVQPLKFTLTIPGLHHVAFVQPTTDNETLKSAIDISCGDKPPKNNPTFDINIPYINRRELFKVTAFFDGQPQRPIVACRLPNVDTQISSEEQQQATTDNLTNRAIPILTILSAVGFVTTVVTVIWTTIYVHTDGAKQDIERLRRDLHNQKELMQQQLTR